jgi:hypothetical protein
VETLCEYKCILLGHLITINTDHKNLTFSNFTTDRVTRWRLIVEEYGPKIVYLPVALAGKINNIGTIFLNNQSPASDAIGREI